MSVTGSVDVNGVTRLTGNGGPVNLLGNSGSLVLGNNTTTPNYSNLSHISSSNNTNVNLILKDTTASASTVVSGSGNIFTNPSNAAAGMERYMSNYNAFFGGTSVPQISQSMNFSPTVNYNIAATQGSSLTFRGPDTTLSTWNAISNLFLGGQGLNFGTAINPMNNISGSVQISGNVLGNGTMNVKGYNNSTLTGPFNITGNIVNGGLANLNAFSSSLNFNSNAVNALLEIDNSYLPSPGTVVAGQSPRINFNMLYGNGHRVILSGSNVNTAQTKQFIHNLLQGEFITATLGDGDSSNIVGTAIIGNSLIVSGSSTVVNANLPYIPNDTHGSTFLGRYNSLEGDKAKTAETIFAVGTGTSSSRRTGLLIDSGSNVHVDGNMYITGALNVSNGITGSLEGTASYATQALSASYAPSVSIDTGSFATTGSNTFIGNQNITGSVNQTGSMAIRGTDGTTPIILTVGHPNMGPLTITNNGSLSTFQSIKGYGMENINTSPSNYSITNGVGDISIYGKFQTGSVILGLNQSSKTIVTGSLSVSNGITGSLEGTASYATQALSASYAPQDPLPSGLVSGSSQISYTGITDVPSDIVSGSSQVSFTGITDVPTGLVSGSSQISDLGFAITGSNTFLGNQIITGSVDVTGSVTLNNLVYPTIDGGEKSFIQTDGNGNLSLQYVDTLIEPIRNGEATTLLKGTPVYVSGALGANPIVFAADAGDPTKMPVIYIVKENIVTNEVGEGILLGKIEGVDTTGYAPGTEIFVGVGGGWTQTRPTGSAIIQSLGIVTKEGVGGQGIVLNPGPANLPNLPTNELFIGDVNSYPVPKTINEIGLAITGSNVFDGNQTITGSLSVRNGDLEVISNNTTLNIDTYLTNSLDGQTNIIKGWGDNPALGGPQANQLNYTGSLIITGSNNTVSVPQIRATGVGLTVNHQGYISGSDNVIAGNNSGIYMNTTSLLFPKTQGNWVGNGSNIGMTFTTSSLPGGHPTIQNNTIYGGSIRLNHSSGSAAVIANLLNGAGLTSTQNFVTNVRPLITANYIGSQVNINHISSSVNYQNNINNSPITINNHLSSSIVNNSLTFGSNTILGGSQNTVHNIYVSGSQSTNVSRLISDNLIGGRNNIVSSSVVGSSNANLLSTIVYGNGLTVSGSHTAGTNGGSAFFGRFNDTTTLHLAQDIVFAVGTGTAAGSRKTGLYVTSGSLVGVSGSLDVKGDTTITGSVQGNVTPLSITSNTASLDLNTGNFFTITLPNGSTHLEPTNIKPGQTVSVKVIGDLTSTVTFPSSVKQPSGSLYTPSVSGTDILTFVSFDSSDVYVANVKNLI